MDYSDYPDAVAEGVFAGLAYMDQYGVPTNPNNIAVWYAYASGQYPDVSNTIDEHIAKGDEFTDRICADIHEKYFGVTRESLLVEDASERIVGELNRAQEYVTTASENTSQIEQRLKTHAEKLSGTEAPDGIKSVIDQLIEETEAISKEAGALAEDITSITDEVKSVVESVSEDSKTLGEQAASLANALDSTAVEISDIERGFKDMREESLTDALTGVRNLKFFDIGIQKAIGEADESGHPLSMCVVDLDHFDQFNEAYGRGIGDQVLRLVARTISDCIKGQDSVGRIGGEEFGVLLPDTPRQGAARVAENIRAAFGRKTMKNRKTGEEFGTLTLSVGIAERRADEISTLLGRRANEAMIDAKENGRDQIYVAED